MEIWGIYYHKIASPDLQVLIFTPSMHQRQSESYPWHPASAGGNIRLYELANRKYA